MPLAVLATAVVAWAFYATTGAGSGSGGTTGTMTAAAISVPSTSSGSHTITFTQQAALSNSAFDSQIKYTVQRKEGLGSFVNISSGDCSGQLDHGTASCTDTVGSSGSYTYRAVATYSGWSATSGEAGPVAVTVGAAPTAPTSVALANGGGVSNAYINGSNASSVSVAVGLANATAGDVVGVKITDADEETVEQTALATGGATETVTVTGIDASALEDGSVTLRATSSNGSGSSSATTASVTKDTVKPSSQAGTVANITSGTTFTVPYTTDEAGTNLAKVDLYVDGPDAGTSYAVEASDTSPSQTGESFSYTDATADGMYSFYTLAEDKAGNLEDAPGAADATATRTIPAVLRMATGIYSGNGSDNRAITDVGFQPDVVIVKGNTNQVGVIRTSSMSGDNTKPMSGASGLAGDYIQSLDGSGFTVGTDARVNGNTVSYNWVAFQAGNGTVKVGSYTGNGSSQSITGVGFEPEYVAVLPAAGARAVQRFAGGPDAFAFDSDAGTTTGTSRISALNADGFSVGGDAETNTNGATYHYVAFNEVAGSVDVGSYTGNSTNPRPITGVGFQPEYVAVRPARRSTGNPREGNHRPASLVGSNSMRYANGTNLTNAGIVGLGTDGFTVNNSNTVNENGHPFQYIAFRNTGGGCGVPGTYTLGATADTWVNQASPTSTSGGTDSVLKVTSKSPNSNTRALVQFQSLVPTLPTGCTVADAQLRLRNKSPVSGRTIEAYRVGAAWTEAATHWNNQPATVGTAATAVTPSSAAFMTWSVTAMVQAGASNGFLLRDQTENDSGGKEQQFDSLSASAASDRPQLIVSYGN